MNLAFILKCDDIVSSNAALFNVNKLDICAKNKFVSDFDAGFHIS